MQLPRLVVVVVFFTFSLFPFLAGPAASQSHCRAEVEPNNQPESALSFAGPACFTGTLPASDQDIYLLNVAVKDAMVRWTFSLDGVEGTVTGLKVLPVSSAAGVTPLAIGTQLFELSSPPDAPKPVTLVDILLRPGIYVLGISRSGTASGGEPPDMHYSFTIARGDPLPPAGEREPNDDATSATPVQDAFALSGDLHGSADWYAWTISAGAAAKGWQLHAQAPVGFALVAQLLSADGRSLLNVTADSIGLIDLYDLKFPAGSYRLALTPAADQSVPYLIRTTATTPPANDIEPNDDPASAAPFPLDHLVVKGRLARNGDRDFYHLKVDDQLATTLFDLRLIWRSGKHLTFCLDDMTGTALQCRDGTTVTVLANVTLPKGDYLLEISGDPDLNDLYLLRLDRTAAPTGGFETEPNDDALRASAFDPAKIFTGRLTGTEDDFVRTHVTGAPQLWELKASGNGISKLMLVNAAGNTLATGEVAADGTGARLSDLFLTPGDHWFQVSGADGAYALQLTPQGPPDPNQEREPNNEANSAEPLLVGVKRTGRLVEKTDLDLSRFSLAATDHVILRLVPPKDGAIDVTLSTGNLKIMQMHGTTVGQVMIYDALLLPGDYDVLLAPTTASEGRYTFSVDRADPFRLAVDQEPNDSPADARPLPPALSASGTVGEFGDADWFALPPLAHASGLTVHITGLVSPHLSDGTNELPLTPGADPTTFTAENLPSGKALALGVSGNGAYEISASFPNGPAPGKNPSQLPVVLTLSLNTTTVAAYWPQGQRIDGELALVNQGSGPRTVSLRAVTSHDQWSVALDRDSLTIPAGDTVKVPITVRILPDAWADISVRCSIAAQDGSGATATTFVDITPIQDAPPVHPEQAWTVPAPLLGGLDVAATSLGGTPVPSTDPAQEAQLYDGLAGVGAGFKVDGPTLPLALTVKLAGDQPVPVAGIIVNPQADQGSRVEHPRNFTLLLSDDGVTFSPALTGELSLLPIDQPFVLPAPVPARFARLEIDSTYGTPGSAIAIGEWKVIASPGAVPTSDPFNLADPAHGGHIVWMDPQSSSDANFPDGLLSEDLTRQTLAIEAGVLPHWVIGFNDDRAAQITDVEWVDPPGSTPDARFTHVTIEASLASPLGPWQPLADWNLTRARDGTVAPLKLDQPTWARFLRFTGNGPSQTTNWEEPATIRVIEQTTDQTYRSILGEWGADSPDGIFEVLQPPAAPIGPAVSGTPTAAASPSAMASPVATRELAPGVAATGTVQIGGKIDTYRVAAPPGQNQLTFTLHGTPTVGAKLTLRDGGGREVAMTFAPGADPATATYTASVEPDMAYSLTVEQPPHSVAFAFDTSISLANDQPFVEEALRAFAADVQASQEYVNVLPFGDKFLLDDWSDQAYLVESAINGYVNTTSDSAAETALIKSSQALGNREGARAILLVTDAETSSYGQSAELWKTLATVRPIIFAVHVGGNGAPYQTRHFMQDWAIAGGGFYQYTTNHGEMDRAYARLATWLRRPVDYTLTFTASAQAVTPTPTPAPVATQTPTSIAAPPITPTTSPGATTGTLRVVAASPAAGQTAPPPVAADVSVEVIFDTSGSMLQPTETGLSRAETAKAALTDLVSNTLPPGTPLTLRTFGAQPGSCDTTLVAPLAPLDPPAMAAEIANVPIINEVKTPIGAALAQVATDLKDATGTRLVVLVTDGEETCGGDPRAEIQKLVAQGFDVRINIVGFALNDEALKAQFQEWARLGNGEYIDASSADELGNAVARAVAPTYRVLDASGQVVATGVVGGRSARLAPGTYTVEVLTEPIQLYDNVMVKAGKPTTLQV